MRKILYLTIAFAALFACDKRPNKQLFKSGAEKAGSNASSQALIEPSTLQRLNRFEYNNTIQDLMDMTLTPADAFPTDPVTHGFDNVGSNLTLSPALTDLLSQASEIVAKTAVAEISRTAIDVDPVKAAAGKNGNSIGNAWSVTGELSLPFNLSFDESLQLDVFAGGIAKGVATPRMTLRIDGKDIKSFEVAAEALSPIAYSINADLTKGQHTLSVKFDNQSALDPFTGAGNQLVVTRAAITSKEKVATDKSKQLKACATQADKEACKRNMILQLAEKAWRRPLTEKEKSDISDLWKGIIAANGTDEDALKTALQALTLSSKFLFRTVAPLSEGSEKRALLDDYSIANRLSYFLWSSMPDADLFNPRQTKIFARKKA